MNEYLILSYGPTHEQIIQVPIYDEDGNPILDDDGEPVTEDQVITVESYPKNKFRCLVEVEDIPEGKVLNILHTSNPVAGDDDLISGCEVRTGIPVAPTNEALFKLVVPLGNLPEQDIYDENGDVIDTMPAGQATGFLGTHTWAGVDKRHLGEDGAFYPGTDQPFPVIIRRKYFPDEENDGTYAGNGWRAEFDADLPVGTRDPTEYFVNIYNDPKCTVNDSWYQAGSFALQDSEWQRDTEGNPRQVYAVEYNQGHLGVPERVVIHHALCKGSIHIQQGYGTLDLNEEEDSYFFWEYTQGAGGAYVDSGIEVTGILGNGTYNVSDSDGFIVDEILKIDDVETKFLRVHSPGIIVVETHVAAAVGKNIFWIR